MTDPNFPTRWTEYLALAKERPELFVQPQTGGVRLLLDRDEALAVEQEMARVLRARGLPESGALVGIVEHDPYFYVVRDAVEFPDGARRTYTRVVYRSPGGVIVVPVLDGRIVMIRQFRHAPRQWLLEVPRGGIEPGHTPGDAARAEIREEIGGEIVDLLPMGQVYALSSLQSTRAHTFYARVSRIGEPQREDAIAGIELVGVEDFERRVLAGDIVDGLTITAFTHARLRGLV